MDVAFNNWVERNFVSESSLQRAYGARRARSIIARLLVLRRADTLSEISTYPPERRHQLTGNRAGQFAVDIDHQMRLIFIPAHDPIPLRPDGGIDTGQITAIIITAVLDYH